MVHCLGVMYFIWGFFFPVGKLNMNINGSILVVKFLNYKWYCANRDIAEALLYMEALQNNFGNTFTKVPD
jgi:hypothetical protein